MKVIEDKKNPLLNRREVKVIIEAAKNPSMPETVEIISEEFKSEEDKIVIRYVRGKFGRNTFLIGAFIYNTKEDKDKTEIISRKQRKKQAEEAKKAETAEKPVEEPEKPTEESIKPTEEKQEDKIVEKQTEKVEEGKETAKQAEKEIAEELSLLEKEKLRKEKTKIDEKQEKKTEVKE